MRRVVVDKRRLAGVLQRFGEALAVFTKLQGEIQFFRGCFETAGESNDGMQVRDVDVIVAAFEEPVAPGHQ